MDFIDKVKQLSKRSLELGNKINTEEATKNALIMPFLQQVLSYDPFNPSEVIPEFTLDVGIKKNEKIDYAICVNDELQILIECKSYQTSLSAKHESQLFRYFSASDARIAILTNGREWQFFTDLQKTNKMDSTPYFSFDLENLQEDAVPEIKKYAKCTFNVNTIISTAEELKYLSAIKKIIKSDFDEPSDELVRYLTSCVYDGKQTPKVKNQFSKISKKALQIFLKESIKEKLESVITSSNEDDNSEDSTELEPKVESIEIEDNNNLIITTEEEIEGYTIVKSILREKIEPTRIVHRDTQSYMGILLDDNNRKILARLHFNTKLKYLGILDENKKETRYALETLDCIFDYKEQLFEVADRLLN